MKQDCKTHTSHNSTNLSNFESLEFGPERKTQHNAEATTALHPVIDLTVADMTSSGFDRRDMRPDAGLLKKVSTDETAEKSKTTSGSTVTSPRDALNLRPGFPHLMTMHGTTATMAATRLTERDVLKAARLLIKHGDAQDLHSQAELLERADKYRPDDGGPRYVSVEDPRIWLQRQNEKGEWEKVEYPPSTNRLMSFINYLWFDVFDLPTLNL